ncbi:hypothetical protein DH2020_032511 [Rehmannia glutinosa]|uniref:protein-S-isoprenylcysteine alpha-carbonyl methylesterase n=1 Tax=Rehmannia glutinosa TaxID=99300 RepID=A0ABR0VHE9_REHGL
MQSHLLPVSNPSTPSSSSSASPTMLIRSEDDLGIATTRIFMPPSFEEDKKNETIPFITRTLSYTEAVPTSANSNSYHQKRRRRVASDNSLLIFSGDPLSAGRRPSFRQEVGRAASDTYLVTRLSFKLLRYLGLDLYVPKNSEGPKPVVAFITGGAWIIGYAFILAALRNFPQGTISDMVKDASQGISFVCNNIAEYGGDPNRIYLMGQSAGAHIAACALLEQAIKEAGGEKTSWSVSQIKAYFGLSGGIMEGEESLRRYSPEVVVQDPNNRNAVSLLPRIVLFHGTADYSIPSDSSKSFAETLQSLGVQAESILYEGKTHTDLFLQDPMRGGTDDMFEDLVAMIHAGDSEALAKHAKAPPRKRLVPEFMLKLARSAHEASARPSKVPVWIPGLFWALSWPGLVTETRQVSLP